MKNQKGFISIFMIVIISIVIASAGTGAVLHKQGKLTFLENIENTEIENKSELERLQTNQEKNFQTEQELEQVKIEAERAKQETEKLKQESQKIKELEQKIQKLEEAKTQKRSEVSNTEQCPPGYFCNGQCWSECSTGQKPLCSQEGLICCVPSSVFCNDKCWLPCSDKQKFICPSIGDPYCEEQESNIDIDNDGDGLTYQEELKLGTSDLLADTDGDGIPDSEDTSPLGIGRYLYIIHKWHDYNGNYWDWGTRIPDDRFDYYENKIRVPHGASYVTWDDPVIEEIGREFLDMAEKKNLDKWGASFLAMSFVQSLDYIEDFSVGYDEYPKYPIETLIERNGDCEDSSYLLCSLLWGMKQPCVLLKFTNHMAVGVRVTDSPPFGNSSFPVTYYYVDDVFGGSYYLYVETTAEDWLLGKSPEEYRDVTPEIIEIIDYDSEESEKRETEAEKLKEQLRFLEEQLRYLEK